jgi:hypothetical protein
MAFVMIRARRVLARCTDCGAKGAILQHPSWTGSHVGFEPFPA